MLWRFDAFHFVPVRDGLGTVVQVGAISFVQMEEGKVVKIRVVVVYDQQQLTALLADDATYTIADDQRQCFVKAFKSSWFPEASATYPAYEVLDGPKAYAFSVALDALSLHDKGAEVVDPAAMAKLHRGQASS